MNSGIIFSTGNVIADASIAAFALLTWIHERQDNRLRRLSALLLSEGNLDYSQVAIIEAWVFSGKKMELEQSADKYGIEKSDRKKLMDIMRNLSYLRRLMILVLVLFPVGIAIEAYALLVG